MTATPDYSDIDLAAEDFRAAHDRLADLLAALREAHQALVLARLPAIRAAVIRARSAKEHLGGLVEGAPELFVRPKTRVFHGIETGYRKAPDTWTYPPDSSLVAAIRQQLPELAPALVEITERPNKPSIKMLASDALAALGVRIQSGSDVLVLKPVDSEVDKMISALLGDAAKEIGHV